MCIVPWSEKRNGFRNLTRAQLKAKVTRKVTQCVKRAGLDGKYS
jgi:hypothetical protein